MNDAKNYFPTVAQGIESVAIAASLYFPNFEGELNWYCSCPFRQSINSSSEVLFFNVKTKIKVNAIANTTHTLIIAIFLLKFKCKLCIYCILKIISNLFKNRSVKRYKLILSLKFKLKVKVNEVYKMFISFKLNVYFVGAKFSIIQKMKL